MSEPNKQPSAKQPKWQRGRIIDSYDLKELIGKEIWITGKPILRTSVRFSGDFVTAESFSTNVEGWDSVGFVVNKKHLELLPEFADDVPFLRWEEFLAQPKERHA